MERPSTNNKSVFYGTLLIWLATQLSFIFTYLTNDFFVFWAYSHQVDLSPLTGIDALLDSWDIKGILFRAFVFIQYKITTLFFDDFCLSAQYFYKFIGLTQLNIILLAAVKLIPQEFTTQRIRKPILFFVLSTILIACHFSSHLQPEMVSTYIFILALSLTLRNDLISKTFAGILMALTFFLKSPLPLMGGCVFFSILIFRDNTFKEGITHFIPIIISFTITLVMALILIYTCYSQEITDILNASYYQKTLFHEFTASKLIKSSAIFGKGLSEALLYIPVIIVGFIFMIKNLLIYRKWQLPILWIFPVIYIMLSNCFFAYHYYLFVFPSIITILYYFHKKPKDITNKKNLFYILPVAIYIYFLSAISPNVIKASKAYSENYNETMSMIDGKYGNGEVMFLDAGQGAFFMPNKSYLRYFYPLPIQRIYHDNKFRESETYKSVYKEIMNFEGEYVTLDTDWFFHFRNPEIEKKLHNEYAECSTINAITFRWDLFGQPYQYHKIKILKKKHND